MRSYRRLPQLFVVAGVLLCAAQARADEDGFSRPYVLSFKLNTEASKLSKEALRFNYWNAKKNGLGTGTGTSQSDPQSNTNMNNVVQINNTLVLNGDNNTVTFDGGKVTDPTQTSTDTSQSGTNQRDLTLNPDPLNP